MFGSAYNAEQAASLLKELSKEKGQVQSQVHIDDFVGRVVGGNQEAGGTTPINSNFLKEWVKIFYGNSTAHNNYGESRPDNAGQIYWQDSPDGKAITKIISPK